MIERKTLQAGALVVTPVQRIDHVWVKRDDLYHVAGVNGGKARACWGFVVKLVCAGGVYNVPVAGVLGSVALAGLYEAKCLPFL